MQAAIEIQGSTDPRFRAVEDAFRENFSRFPEVGAALCVYVDGRPVVDVWGGYADAERTRPWQRDTLVNVWSTTKGITATCAHRLAGESKLDLDSPVATYWPEFAQNGKESVLVRHLLCHQAGLCATHQPLPPGSAYNWQFMTDTLAAEEPWWEPGTKNGYHAFTYGWLVGEVVRRVSGKSIGAYWRDEIAGPLGLDFHIGIGPEEDHRIADCLQSTSMEDLSGPLVKAMQDPTSLTFRALTTPPDPFLPGAINSREWRAAEIAAANGHGTARSIAKLYAALSLGGELDGFRVMTASALERATTEAAYAADEVLIWPMRWALGFGMGSEGVYIGPNPRSFGHSGAGGSLGYADPDARIGFGYTMNQMLPSDTLEDRRWRPLLDALYAAL
jgi:CubicO group peptidase (beta-lactamase class C family)